MDRRDEPLWESAFYHLDACMNAYTDELESLSPGQLIGRAEEIAAAHLCYNELAGKLQGCSDELLEGLLQLDDPLKVLREQWLEEHSTGDGDEFEKVLRTVVDRLHPEHGGMALQ